MLSSDPSPKGTARSEMFSSIYGLFTRIPCKYRAGGNPAGLLVKWSGQSASKPANGSAQTTWNDWRGHRARQSPRADRGTLARDRAGLALLTWIKVAPFDGCNKAKAPPKASTVRGRG